MKSFTQWMFNLAERYPSLSLNPQDAVKMYEDSNIDVPESLQFGIRVDDSEAITFANYNPRTLDLEVVYTSGGVYRYKDVPLEAYQTLTESWSKGRFINGCIKKMYDYEKVV